MTARAPIDFAALMPDVARALLGEPNRRLSTARELRYSTHGSLAVHVGGEYSGTWRDHEAGEGGGVLALVAREAGARDSREAMAWLRDAGLLDGAGRYRVDSELAGRDTPSKRRYRLDSALAPAPPDDADARIRLASALWAATAPADDSPGHDYLAGRRCAWPPSGTGPNLPASVRWLAREAAPARDVAARWYGLPAGACGALTFAYQPLPAPEPLPAAVSLLAVSAAGERVTWFGERAVKVCSVGSHAGLVFTARPGPAGEPLHVAEGETTALTLAADSWCGPGAVVATGGTSGLRNVELPRCCFRNVTVWADRDAGGEGQAAAVALAERLQAEGREVEIQLPPLVGDWNDVRMLAREAS